MMNEQQWLSSDNPAAMLQWLLRAGASDPYVEGDRHRVASDRKLRLWVEACRTMAHGPADYVKDLQSPAGLRVALEYWRSRDAEKQLPLPNRAALLRDIVGNPFRPVTLPCACHCGPRENWPVAGECPNCFSEGWCPWRTDTVLSLAQAAYEDNAGRRRCEKCKGKGWWWRCPNCHGEWGGKVGPDCFVCSYRQLSQKECPECNGTGKIADGSLDPQRLLILSDALEEAGAGESTCPDCNGTGMMPDNPQVNILAFCQRCQPKSPDGIIRGRGTGRVKNPLVQHLRGYDLSPLGGGSVGDLWRPVGPHVRGCWALDCILGKE